jgi:hypothetical protein
VADGHASHRESAAIGALADDAQQLAAAAMSSLVALQPDGNSCEEIVSSA